MIQFLRNTNLVINIYFLLIITEMNKCVYMAIHVYFFTFYTNTNHFLNKNLHSFNDFEYINYN